MKKSLDSWWGRTSPVKVRVAMMLVSLVVMALGGSADEWWG